MYGNVGRCWVTLEGACRILSLCFRSMKQTVGKECPIFQELDFCEFLVWTHWKILWRWLGLYMKTSERPKDYKIMIGNKLKSVCSRPRVGWEVTNKTTPTILKHLEADPFFPSKKNPKKANSLGRLFKKDSSGALRSPVPSRAPRLPVVCPWRWSWKPGPGSMRLAWRRSSRKAWRGWEM